MNARITGPDNGEGPHTWIALFPAPLGKWTEGGITGDSAYEANGRKVKPGTVVELVASGHEYRFFAPLTRAN